MEERTKRETNKEVNKDDIIIEKLNNIEIGIALILTNQTLTLERLMNEASGKIERSMMDAESIKEGIFTTNKIINELINDVMGKENKELVIKTFEKDSDLEELENILKEILLK